MEYTPGPWYVGKSENKERDLHMGVVMTEHAARLITAAPDLLAALEAVEWVAMPIGMGDFSCFCPWCGGEEVDDEEIAARILGHKPDCIRQAAIARARGEDDAE